MKKIDRLIIILFILEILINVFCVISNANSINIKKTTDGLFDYKILNDGNVEIIKYNGMDRNEIIIPQKIKNRNVISIGNDAFSASHITKVILQNGIVNIGNNAFFYCPFLKEIVMPQSIRTIGDYAFSSCEKLINLTISKDVEKIGNGIVYYCENLENIYVDNNNQNYCSENGILYNKDKTVLIVCPMNNKENQIRINENILTIQKGAFDYCKNISFINVDNNNQNYCSENGILYNKDKTVLIKYPPIKNDIYIKIDDNVKTISAHAFAKSNNIQEIIIPNNVNIIEKSAFADMIELVNLEISDNIKVIEPGMCSQCIKLKNVKLPTKLEQISDFAFYECKSINSIIIPKYVKIIGNNAFGGCNKFLKMVLPNSVSNFDNNCFHINSYNKIEIYTNNEIVINILNQNGNGVFCFNILNLKESITINEFKKQFNNDNLKFVNFSNEEIVDGNVLLTSGMKILQDKTKKYLVIINGDLNGDAKFNDIDVLKLARYKAKLDLDIEIPYLLATDLNKDEEYGSDIDLLKMIRVLVNLDNL